MMAIRFAATLIFISIHLCIYAQDGVVYLIQNQRELFIDSYLVDSTVRVHHRLKEPVPMGKVMKFDKPWEGQFSAYVSIVEVDGVYHMYYRGIAETGNPLAEVTCYAVSVDGIHWVKPKLGLFEVNGTTENNVVLLGSDRQTSHNFTVFYDERVGVDPNERFKAVGGTASNQTRPLKGLYRYVSPDGIRWELFRDSTALFPGYAMDSQNIITWLPEEECYALYLRTWTDDQPGDGKLLKGIRTISRSVSTDFVNWTEPVEMTFGKTPLEDLYTNATAPYFRAPHLLIATPFRFAPDSRVLTDEEFKELGVHPSMWQGVSDAVFMTSRGGTNYDRTFLESFVRPGSNAYNWAARSNIPAAGIIQTGDDEMSLYVTRAYGTDDVYLERLKLRLDGFAAFQAGYGEGYITTKPVLLQGDSLSLNFSTSSIGYVKVVLLDEQGSPIAGFTENDAIALVGDEVDGCVRWSSGRSIRDLEGQPLRVKFILRDADVYAFGVWE